MGVRVRVLKFGGSSLASTDQIETAAARVAETTAAGLKPVIVVSAMAGVTDQLLALARRLHADPSSEELDRLLATGESQVACFLAMALQRRGLNARSFTGGEAGITTDTAFGHARILEVNPSPLAASLAAGELPVVAGFQGGTRDGRVTTLGRGGSDISAVALGNTLGADRVVVFRHVEGVHSADPRMLPLSYRLERLDYDSMIDLAEAGAALLHPQSLEMARAHRMPLEVRGITSTSDSTFIADESAVAHLPVWMVLLSHPVAVISVDSLPQDTSTLARLLSLLDRTDLCVDGTVQSTDSRTGLCLTLMLPDLEGPVLQDQLRDFLREESGVTISIERRQRRVTLVGRGVVSRRVQVAIDHVAQRLGPPMASFSGARHRAFLVPDREGPSWLASLHQELIQR
jgi:aspartate kinase